MGNMRKRDSAAGGLGLLALTVCLCWKGMKAVDRRLRREAERKKPRR